MRREAHWLVKPRELNAICDEHPLRWNLKRQMRRSDTELPNEFQKQDRGWRTGTHRHSPMGWRQTDPKASSFIDRIIITDQDFRRNGLVYDRCLKKSDQMTISFVTGCR